jgi:pimeloyl-ACP methyl ester carboxylesterase
LAESSFLPLSTGEQLAYHHLPGALPGLLFCGGFTSDMNGTKALALEAHCRATGRAFTRFDYRGHGASGGRFADGTIGDWCADALTIVDGVTTGPLIVAGSSMGGWIMLLAALARPGRIRALVGIAAAPDFTEDLLLPGATPAQRRALAEQGFWLQPSAYGEQPYPVTARLLEDGRRHLVLRAPIPLRCPVHLLHGQRDPDVPWQTALRLAELLETDDVTIELIKSGDHRLSTVADLDRITAAIERLAARFGQHPAGPPESQPRRTDERARSARDGATAAGRTAPGTRVGGGGGS